LIVPIFELSIAFFLQQFEMHHMQVTETWIYGNVVAVSDSNGTSTMHGEVNFWSPWSSGMTQTQQHDATMPPTVSMRWQAACRYLSQMAAVKTSR
jgi:hypothetical protein